MPQEFKDPCAMTKAEIWEALSTQARDEPVVHAAMRATHRLDFDPEHAALVLAFALLQTLQGCREEFEAWVKFNPRPVNVNPGPEFMRCLMAARKG